MTDEKQIAARGERIDNQAPRPVSDRKLKANRENAKESTGPKTARGKRHSSFNALKHGLLGRCVALFTDDEDYNHLREMALGLDDRYGREDDVRTKLLIELAVVDYWRLLRGLGSEGPQCGEGPDEPSEEHLLRYNTANRQSLIKILDMLEQGRHEKLKCDDNGSVSNGSPVQFAPRQDRKIRPRKPFASDSQANPKLSRLL